MSPSSLPVKPLGPLWWLKHLAGIPVVLLLMAVGARALSVLTRMVVEGEIDPAYHAPTFWAWFVVCSGLLLWGVLGDSWQDLKDERVHVDLSGNELVINRWSPEHERQRFAERRASDDRMRERHRAEPRQPPAPREMSSAELRSAARRRREVGPGLPSSRRVGRWSRPLRRLDRVATACLIAGFPLTIALGLGMDLVLPSVPRAWTALPLALLPLGWCLRWAHRILMHRWLRDETSRSSLAFFHMVSLFVAAFVLALVTVGALVDREFLLVAPFGFVLMLLAGRLGMRELQHVITGPSDPHSGSSSGLPPPNFSALD